jgi:hypothetical protein
MQNDLLFIQNTSIDSTEYEEKFVNLTANKVVFVDTNNLPTTTGIGLSTQFLKADGSLDSTIYEPILPETPINPDNKYLNGNRLWSEISIGAGGYAGNVYASNVDSDISGYKTMSYALDSTESIRSIVVNNNTVLSETCLYETGVGVTVIPSGLWKATFYAKVNSTIGDTTLKIQVFTRHLTDGSETDLFEITSPTIENTSDYSILRFEGSQIAFTVFETDRVGIRIKGSTTRTQNTTINYIIGDGRGLYITTPLQIRHSQLRNLNGDTNYLHVTSTEKSTWNNSVPYTGATTNVDLGLNFLNANTLKLDGTELLIDAFKSGSLGGAGNIFYSTGANSQPASGTVNQVVGNNYIQNQNSIAQNANMWISGVISSSGARLYASNGFPLRAFSNLKVNDLWYGSLVAGKAEDLYQACQFGWVFNESNPINSFAHITPYGRVEGEMFKLTATGAATFASTIQATTAKLTNLTDGYLPLHQNYANGLVNSNIYQDMNGNVGIGTTEPVSTLQIAKTVTAGYTKTNNYLGLGGSEVSDYDTHLIGMGYAGTTYYPTYFGSMQSNNAGETNAHLVFGTRSVTTDTQPSERMRITSDGNVGIGTTTPLSKLSINGGLHVGGDSDAGDNNILADGTITGTQFIGSGTGLTGTASGLSIGGNASTATKLIGSPVKKYGFTYSEYNYSNIPSLDMDYYQSPGIYSFVEDMNHDTSKSLVNAPFSKVGGGWSLMVLSIGSRYYYQLFFSYDGPEIYVRSSYYTGAAVSFGPWNEK